MRATGGKEEEGWAEEEEAAAVGLGTGLVALGGLEEAVMRCRVRSV